MTNIVFSDVIFESKLLDLISFSQEKT